MRDTMARRGPDGAGLWRKKNVVLAHRRLEVVAPGPEGAQPFVTPAGSALVYNGELYNDRELREALRADGAEFRTRSDTETLALQLERKGLRDFHHIRGMYAFGFVDARRHVLVLARDPLGIKPLFWAEVDGEIVFASDVRAILAHPRMSVQPDMVTLSSYLSTIRLTLNERTMFSGIRTLRPGEWIEIDRKSVV